MGAGNAAKWRMKHTDVYESGFKQEKKRMWTSLWGEEIDASVLLPMLVCHLLL